MSVSSTVLVQMTGSQQLAKRINVLAMAAGQSLGWATDYRASICNVDAWEAAWSAASATVMAQVVAGAIQPQQAWELLGLDAAVIKDADITASIGVLAASQAAAKAAADAQAATGGGDTSTGVAS